MLKNNSELADEYHNGFKPIHYACASGNELLVRYLVTQGADINSPTKTVGNQRDMHPLHIAALYGNVNFFNYLLNMGAQLTTPDRNNVQQPIVDAKGYNVLQIAAQNGHIELVNHLLKLGFDPLDEVLDKSFENLQIRSTAFDLAQLFQNKEKSNNYKEICSQLINAHQNDGPTMLQQAITEDNDQRVIHLIEHGASIDNSQSKSNSLFLALSRALHRPSYPITLNDKFNIIPAILRAGGTYPFDDSFSVFAALLKVGANPNSIHYKTHFTCLAEAIINNSKIAAQLLLTHKADPNLAIEEGTPLFLAIIFNNHELVELLLNGGADSNEIFKDMSPLYFALHKAADKNNPVDIDSYITIMELLLEKKARINTKFKGSTPLDLALTLKNKKLIYLLINEPVNETGSTSLHQAVEANDITKTKLLIENGANCQQKNKLNLTPLQICKKNGNQGNKEAQKIYQLLRARLTR